jgi:hypothetical protein
MAVEGMKFPEALIQQTNVIVCPSSLTVLLTELFPLDTIHFGVFVGTVLTNSSILR